jgi:hypothetical protein
LAIGTMKTLTMMAAAVLACGLAIGMHAQTRDGVRVAPFQSTLVKPPPDPKEVERVRKWLKGLTTFDLLGYTEPELRLFIPFEPTRFEKDERAWYWDGSSVHRNGDIIGRFRVLTFVEGKVAKHEIIDGIIGCALPRMAPAAK